MSLNGDVMVMRNGRSTSQISIYNYPEHLNPFYEDEQHKRLRFWHINKKGNGEEGRRNSFSMSGLKDIWAFKSFRLSKKKSSTLGINKTSESPPPLRRDVDYNYSYDPRSRHSAQDGSGSSFQRGAYRSSLQNMHTQQDRDVSFDRNNQYRSTIQFAGRNANTGTQYGGRSVSASNTPQPRRYVPMTPQPVRNNYNSMHANGRLKFNGDSSDLTHGLSQSSISTNPFDSDYEDENDATISGDVASTGGKRTPRKKRRAPAVPGPSHTTSTVANTTTTTTTPRNEMPANDSTSQSIVITAPSQQIVEEITSQPRPDVDENVNKTSHSANELHIDEDSLDICNLTAEIESFVKCSNESDDVVLVVPPVTKRKTTTTTTTTTRTSRKASPPKPAPRQDQTSPVNSTQIKKLNGTLPTETVISTTTITSRRIENDGKEIYRDNEPIPTLIFERRSPIGVEDRTPSTPSSPVQQGKVECMHVQVPNTNPDALPSSTIPVPVTTFRSKADKGLREDDTVKKHEIIEANTPFVLAHPPKSTTTSKTSGEKSFNEPQLIIVEDNSSSSSVSAGSLPATLSAFSLPTPPTTPIHQQLSLGKKPVIAAKPTHLVMAEIHKPSRQSLTKVDSSPAASSSSTPPDVLKIEENITITVSELNANSGNDGQTQVLNEEKNTARFDREPTPIALDHTQQVERLITKRTTTAFVNDVSQQQHRSGGPPSPPPRSLTAEQEERLRIVESNDSLASGYGDNDGWLYRPKPRSSILDWKQSTLAPLNKNVPPEKRKSVKDIIESINRSQRLLHAAAHKEPTHQTLLSSAVPIPISSSATEPPPTYAQSQSRLSQWSSDAGPLSSSSLNGDSGDARVSGATSTPLLPRKFSEPNNNFDENRDAPVKSPRRSQPHNTSRSGDDLSTSLTTVMPSTSAAAAAISDCGDSNEPVMEEGQARARPISDPTKLDNSEDVFKKCRVVKEVYDYRETSPTACNLDWNPVPKPKRTKNPPEP